MLIFRAWATCGRMRRIFLLETSLILFTEAVVTLAVFLLLLLFLLSLLLFLLLFVFFFFAHITLRCPHDLNAWNRLVLVQLAIEVK